MPTTEDMQAVHDFAVARGLRVKYWKPTKLDLIICLDDRPKPAPAPDQAPRPDAAEPSAED